ncbi:MAG: amidase [Planctomycetia bacterium]|nr:amidase [Planctomycetia bacterium]
MSVNVDPSPNDRVSRRKFLGDAALGSALATGAAMTFPDRSSAVEPEAPSRPAAVPSFELEELSIRQLQEGMTSGKWTSRAITQHYLDRIAAVDQRGPAVNHVLEINPDALEIAAALDKERKEQGPRGPLHGVPVLIKDNVGTADKMNTTAGSLALVGARPAQDSFVAKKLREAGAVILGKTCLSEWANFRSTRSSSGWCGRAGQGKNPYALDRNPSGSSSGTGGAIAASLASAGVGSETDGSIVSPASACSLVGVKPTLGLISRAGIVPLAHSQDTAGPMCRTVEDAAILLSALAGVDPRDAATSAAAGNFHPDYTRFLHADSLRGARIGVPRKGLFGRNPASDKLAETAIDALKRAGAEIIDPADIPHLGEYDNAENEVLFYDFKHDINAYLAGLGPEVPVKTLADLIDFNEKNRDREMPFFGQEIFLKAQQKGPLTDKAYVDALEKCVKLSRVEGLEAVLGEHRLDALVAPTGPPPWPIDLVNGDPSLGGSSSPAAVSGCASITVPAGYVFGLPIGISFIGKLWSEPTLLKLAYAFEQATKHRRPPRFLPTADFTAS